MSLIIGFEVLAVLCLIIMFIVMFKCGKKSKYRFIPLSFSIIFFILFVRTTYCNFYFYSKFNKADVYVIDILESNNGKGYSFLSQSTKKELQQNWGMYDRVTLQYSPNISDIDKILMQIGFKKLDFILEVKENTGLIVDKGFNYSAVEEEVNGKYKTYIVYSDKMFDLDEVKNINEMGTYVMFYSIDNLEAYNNYTVYKDCYMDEFK